VRDAHDDAIIDHVGGALLRHEGSDAGQLVLGQQFGLELSDSELPPTGFATGSVSLVSRIVRSSMPLRRAIACLAFGRTASAIAITPRKRPSHATNKHVNATDLLLECTLHRFDLTANAAHAQRASFPREWRCTPVSSLNC
jgi:hypothetical protein